MSLFGSAILSEIAGAAIAAVGAVYVALPVVMGRRTQLVQMLGAVSTVCEKVVSALEQTQGGSLTGAAKKALALELVNTILSSLGVKAPAPFIDAAIEAAVLGLAHLSASSSVAPTASIAVTSGTSGATVISSAG